LHCEINAWQNIFDIFYHEAIDRHLFQKFIETLSGPVGSEISDNHRSDDASDAHAPGQPRTQGLLRAKALVNAGQILPDFGSIFESH
jgi:hypothetical protein